MCSNFLSQWTPHTKTYSDIGKSFTTTIYKEWHTIVCDTMLSTIWPSKPLSTNTRPSHSQPSCLLHTNTWLITTQHLTQPLTYTYTHPHTNTPTIATLYFYLPLTTLCIGSWLYWQHYAMKINLSPKHNTTYQCAPCHTGYLRISVYLFNGSLFWSNNIFLNDLCHYMVFSISEFSANIYTFITHTD